MVVVVTGELSLPSAPSRGVLVGRTGHAHLGFRYPWPTVRRGVYRIESGIPGTPEVGFVAEGEGAREGKQITNYTIAHFVVVQPPDY